nr:hypothetical protein GCM10017611_74760 [Rhodococcus wratislaviensis]
MFTDGRIIGTITPRHGRSVVNNSRKRAEPAWNEQEHPNPWRAVWQYSPSRAARDEKTLNLQEARARAVVDGDTVPKVTAKGRRMDTASLDRARMLVGLKGYDDLGVMPIRSASLLVVASASVDCSA